MIEGWDARPFVVSFIIAMLHDEQNCNVRKWVFCSVVMVGFYFLTKQDLGRVFV